MVKFFQKITTFSLPPTIYNTKATQCYLTDSELNQVNLTKPVSGFDIIRKS